MARCPCHQEPFTLVGVQTAPRPRYSIVQYGGVCHSYLTVLFSRVSVFFSADLDLLYVREKEMIIADFTDTMQEDILYDITTN